MLPTSKQLFRRGIITQQQDACCVFCQMQQEDLNHLLLYFLIMKPLWRKIQSLLALDMMMWLVVVFC